MKKILLIATGGTIACVESENGMVPALSGSELTAYVPELKQLADISIKQLMQLDSTNIAPKHWGKIAHIVAESYADYDGFVITHGTDTMAYTAAALYYMLENLNKPVIITGSQLSLTEAGSDAPANLRLAFSAAVSSLTGVYLAFAGTIIQGNAAKKLYTENFSAFKSINVPVAASMEAGGLRLNPAYVPKAGKDGGLTVHDRLDTRVMVLEIIPGLKPDIIRMLTDAGYRGIILKGYGAGNVPNEEAVNNMLPAIDYAVARGVKIIGSSQCLYDGVHMERYEVGRSALAHGVIAGGDFTTEALVVKLMLELGEKC